MEDDYGYHFSHFAPNANGMLFAQSLVCAAAARNRQETV
jgi:hypothetical protein